MHPDWPRPKYNRYIYVVINPSTPQVTSDLEALKAAEDLLLKACRDVSRLYDVERTELFEQHVMPHVQVSGLFSNSRTLTTIALSVDLGALLASANHDSRRLIEAAFYDKRKREREPDDRGHKKSKRRR